MKKFFIFLFLFLCLNNAFAERGISTEEKVTRFYDRLMDLFSYNKYRDFYEEHINPKEISYDDFVSFINNSGISIGGASESKLIGWERKGKSVKVSLELVYKNKGSKKKRIFLNCIEKIDKIILSMKEFKKIYNIKRSEK